MKMIPVFLLSLLLMLAHPLSARTIDPPLLAPEFTQQAPQWWFNSEPLTLRELRGQVVMLDFWTFDCWNCYRSFPWLRELEQKLAEKPFTVIGIHTPEFSHERVRANVKAKIEEFKLEHPVMMDNDFIYWQAMGNRYWPTFYLLDKQGRVRAVYIGETHSGTQQALAIEREIQKLLEE